MSHLLSTVLFGHPLQNLATSIVVEVGINIGQGDTVGVEETLEQKIIFDGVYLGDT